MSRGPLREDKTCLNCGTFVEERFCPQCGQENTETRKSFHYLFTHFVEDLVHYDSSFWKTIKYLLFYPAKLTREYLSGRRQRFVVPVKLYIFISFITFFLSGLVINEKNIAFGDKNATFKVTKSTDEAKVNLWKSTDSIPKEAQGYNNNWMDEYGWFGKYKTVKAFDSAQTLLPDKDKLSKIEYWYIKKMVNVAEHNTFRQAFDKSLLHFKQNLPKVLFLYLPIFAFLLWIFHGKKRWYYFDHGIFTLHYFSFMLLLTCLLILSEWIQSYSDLILFEVLKGIIRIAYFSWLIIYFYKAHKRFYGESKFISFLKSSTLFFINFIVLWVVLVVYILYTAMTIQ